MEDKLVTLAILTYAKAQILKNVLENEGIETYIHNVNQIQPVVSSGVRVRIKESDSAVSFLFLCFSYAFSGSGYSVPIVSTVTFFIFCSSSGLSL